MGFRARPANRAKGLRYLPSVRQRRHCPAILIRWLLGQGGPVDGPPIQPRRRSGFQTGAWQTRIANLLPQRNRRCLPGPPAGDRFLAPKQFAVQKSPGRQNHCLGVNFRTVGHADTGDGGAGQNQARDLSLDDGQAILRIEHPVDGGFVEFPVSLDPRPLHRRALGQIEHAIMDSSGIGSPSDQAVKRIDLADQMALAQPADSRVAGHRPDTVAGKADQSGRHAHARCHGSGLATGMASANHNDIKFPHHAAAHSPSGFAGQNLPHRSSVPRGTIICRYRIYRTARRAYRRPTVR